MSVPQELDRPKTALVGSEPVWPVLTMDMSVSSRMEVGQLGSQCNRDCKGFLLRVISLEIRSRSRSQEARGRGPREMTDIQLLDEQEVSRRLSVSVNTLRYWRVSGDGPNYVKLGRLVRYDAVALEKFIFRNLRVSKARATMEEKHVAL